MSLTIQESLAELGQLLDEGKGKPKDSDTCDDCTDEEPCPKCVDEKETAEEQDKPSTLAALLEALEEEEQDLEQLDEIVGAIKNLISGAKAGYKAFSGKGTNLKTKAGRDKAKKGLGDATNTVAGTIGGMVGGIAGRAARGIKKAVYKSEREHGGSGTSGKKRLKSKKQEKPACPKGEKMVFGQCQKVGK